MPQVNQSNNVSQLNQSNNNNFFNNNLFNNNLFHNSTNLFGNHFIENNTVNSTITALKLCIINKNSIQHNKRKERIILTIRTQVIINTLLATMPKFEVH
jgi:hypothetical protein